MPLGIVAGPAGLGFAIAKPSVPPRSKYREQAPDIYSLRRSVEPTVLILPIANQTKLKAPRMVFSLAEVRLMTSEARKMPLLGAFSQSGWTGRIRTCECWDQNPVPYRLATVQYPYILPH